MSLILLFSIFLGACTGSSFDKLDKNSNQLVGADHNDEDSHDADKDTQAVEPIAIGGAYLICAHDSTLSSPEDQFGCRIEDEAGNKSTNFIAMDSDILAMAHDMAFKGVARKEENSFWHWSFVYNAAEREFYKVSLVTDRLTVKIRESNVLAMHPARPDSAEPAANLEPLPATPVPGPTPTPTVSPTPTLTPTMTVNSDCGGSFSLSISDNGRRNFTAGAFPNCDKISAALNGKRFPTGITTTTLQGGPTFQANCDQNAAMSLVLNGNLLIRFALGSAAGCEEIRDVINQQKI